MAVVAGHNAQVSFSTSQSGILLVSESTRWRVSVAAQSTEVTAFKAAFRAFWPNHYGSTLEIWGWVDQATSPGFISNPVYANLITITIRPNRTDSNKKLVFSGWVERFDWLAAIDSPNSYYASVRGMSTAALTWT